MENADFDISELKPPDKKELGARAKRRTENKDTNEYVIKCGLDKSVRIDINYKNVFLEDIRKRVLQVSKASHHVGILINLLVREYVNKKSKQWEIEIPKDIFNNTTFIYQLIKGKEKSSKAIRYIGDTNSLVTVAAQYITNYKTYLQENFKSKQIAFLKVWCNRKGFDSKYIHQIRFKINGWELKVEDPRTPEMDRLISLHRKILGIENTDMFISKRGWMTHNYGKIVVYFSILSKFLKRNGKREILLAPLPKIKTTFLFIDSSVFKGILSSIKYTNRKQ